MIDGTVGSLFGGDLIDMASLIAEAKSARPGYCGGVARGSSLARSG